MYAQGWCILGIPGTLAWLSLGPGDFHKCAFVQCPRYSGSLSRTEVYGTCFSNDVRGSCCWNSSSTFCTRQLRCHVHCTDLCHCVGRHLYVCSRVLNYSLLRIALTPNLYLCNLVNCSGPMFLLWSKNNIPTPRITGGCASGRVDFATVSQTSCQSRICQT